MGSHIGNRVIFYHQNPVTHADYTKPMGNYNDGFSFAEVLNRLVNLHLIFRIGGTCRFI